MLKIRLSNGLELPKDIVDAFEKSDNKMLCAIFKSNDDEKLSTRDLRTTRFDLGLIGKIIEENQWSENAKDFAIIDANGIVYKSEGSEFEAEFDENGYMHINQDELVVHSHKDGYISGTTKEDVDRRYRHLIDRQFYTQDPNFGENGFKSKPKISAKDIAEADKDKKLTTGEINSSNVTEKDNTIEEKQD